MTFSIDWVFKMRVLVLSPHTDDAELGSGATIARLLEEENEIFWIVFSTAEDAVPEGMDKGILREEFAGVLKCLGVKEEQSKVFRFPVRRLQEHRQAVLDELVSMRDGFRPDLVIGPSLHDYHQDHQVVANEMVRAFKTTSGIISFELPWNHITFDSQMFVGLQRRHMDMKARILKIYRSQEAKQRAYFSEEFIYGLGKTRGVQSNFEYAEAFEVVRWRF